MKDLWESKGYGELSLSSQNLRDQAARLEKSLGNVVELMSSQVGAREEPEGERVMELATNNLSQNFIINSVESSENEANLHMPAVESNNSPLGPVNTLSDDACELLEASEQMIGMINTRMGDFVAREIDTRTKGRPTASDIRNINSAITEMMQRNNISPTENPFEYLWIANCVLYSVVIAFLLAKGWKKQGPRKERSGEINNSKWKSVYEEKVKDARRKISIAKSEMERLKENKKITKKGKKNRALLKEELKDISVAGLVGYMEKEKSQLRKLSRWAGRRKKQEETRALNQQFKQDPGRVYSSFTAILDSDKEAERPVYKLGNNETDCTDKRFESTEDASEFWRELWQKESTGNKDAEWLKEIKAVIHGNVPPPSEEDWDLGTLESVRVIKKKRNWSAPDPDRIANFWWKRAHALHHNVTSAFRSIANSLENYLLWFSTGKSSLIPKPGEFTSANQRSITCLNTLYKWFTSCVLGPMDGHLQEYNLMEFQQRGAKLRCSGTMDNLLIDRAVTQDSRRGKRNISMAWIDVKKAYDSVDHEWLVEMMEFHRFPKWVNKVIKNLCEGWSTRVVTRTTRGNEESDLIRFKRGLPQGHALCPRLFTLCINPVAWKLAATEGYRLSRPVSTSITHLLYMDDLKIYAASESKLNRVLKSAKDAMEDIRLEWNQTKCSIAHVKKGGQVTNERGAIIDERSAIECLKDGELYKFLGVLEDVKQEEKQSLQCAAKIYLRRMSVIWTSPLSDYNRVVASNQFALPILAYLMWIFHWSLTDLRNLDREARKIIVSSGGKHPLSSTALLYLAREKGGRGLRSVEDEYKAIKVKSALKLYTNTDPTMQMVRAFEERAENKGHQSLVKDAKNYAEELGLTLQLTFPEPTCQDSKGQVSRSSKEAKAQVKEAMQLKHWGVLKSEKWQGKLLKVRMEDESLNRKGCFAWLKEWTACPTYTVASMLELYEQLLPTKVYASKKAKSSTSDDVQCRLCRKCAETVPHILAGCSALAQNKYMERHNAALKVLYFELLHDLELIDEVPIWYSPVRPKPIYENSYAQAFWDVPLFAEHNEVRANRVDARVINHKLRFVVTLEMSCPWIENRSKKDEEKALKYGPMR